MWVSNVGREQLEIFDQEHGWARWTLSLFEDVDGRSAAPSPEQIAARSRHYLDQLEIGDQHVNDMAHLAWAALTPWIDTFITNDKRLRKRAHRLGEEFGDEDVQQLRILDPLQAEQELDLQPGEWPQRRSPAPSNPLAIHDW